MQHQTNLVGDGRAAGGAVGGKLALVHLDQVFGLTTSAVDDVVDVLGGTFAEICDDEADVEAHRGRLDAGAGAAFGLPGFRLVAGLDVVTQHWLLLERAAGPRHAPMSLPFGLPILASAIYHAMICFQDNILVRDLGWGAEARAAWSSSCFRYWLVSTLKRISMGGLGARSSWRHQASGPAYGPLPRTSLPMIVVATSQAKSASAPDFSARHSTLEADPPAP